MPTLLQLAQSYQNPESVNYKLAYLREQMEQQLLNLGDLAYEDQVQLAMLGDTIIVGGFLRTELIAAKSIHAEHLNVDDLSAITGKFTSLMAGNPFGARLEMGESAGEPFLDMFDEDELRLKLLKDRIEFYRDGQKAGWMYGNVYEVIPGFSIPEFALEANQSLKMVGGLLPGTDPSLWMYGTVEATTSYVMLRHTQKDYPDGYLYVQRGSEATVGSVRVSSLRVDSEYMWFENHPTTTAAANAVIAVDPKGRFYRSTSAAKYKTDIEPIEEDRAEAFFEHCQPSWYRSLCPDDRKDWSWYGYIADEVAKVEPRLVVFNKEGEPEGVAYDHVVPLLHVVIKHNRKMIEAMQKRLEALEEALEGKGEYEQK
jgi:hypothetical protein